MESIREFLSQSLLLSGVFAILFIAFGILVACYIVRPGIHKLVDRSLGSKHWALKCERAARAAARRIVWEKAEAACRKADKARQANEPVDIEELDRRVRKHARRQLSEQSAPRGQDKEE